MLVVTSLQIIATVALLAGLDDTVAAQAGLHGWMRVVGELGSLKQSPTPFAFCSKFSRVCFMLEIEQELKFLFVFPELMMKPCPLQSS